MTDIVPLAVARTYMRVGGEASDEALQLLVDAATGLMEGYLEYPIIKTDDASYGWATSEDVPASVIVAICIVALDLYDDRHTPVQDIASVRSLAGRYRKQSF